MGLVLRVRAGPRALGGEDMIDFDLCEVFRETPRRAAKSRRCWCCYQDIEVGDFYLYHFSVHDGNASTEALCFRCWWMRADWRQDPNVDTNMTPCPSYTLECLRGESDWLGLWDGPPRTWPYWLRMCRVLERELRHG